MRDFKNPDNKNWLDNKTIGDWTNNELVLIAVAIIIVSVYFGFPPNWKAFVFGPW